MKNKKTLTILLIVMILSVFLVPTLALADDFTGYITISSNNVPTIDTFTVTDISSGTLQPNSSYTVNLTVSDADTLSNISEIMVVFWYTTDSGDPTDLPTFDELDASDSPTLHWIRVWDGGTSFTSDSTNTTWSATDTAGIPADTLTTYDFAFTVTVGKEAQEVVTAGDTDKWQIAVKVTDADSNTDFMLANDATSTPLSMEWYGEMNASIDAGPQWSGVQGLTYSDTSAAAQVFDATRSLTIISNGDYSLQAYADTTWTDTALNDITYDTAIDAADEFSIAIGGAGMTYDGTAVELTNDADSDGSTEAVTIDTSSASWGVGTDYDGDLITTIYMFLQTNASMTVSTDEYTGTVTLTLVNN